MGEAGVTHELGVVGTRSRVPDVCRISFLLPFWTLLAIIVDYAEADVVIVIQCCVPTLDDLRT